MLKSKALDILRSFSEEEVEEFVELIKVSNFNKRNKLSDFFKVLGNFYPEFDDENLTAKFIFKKLYPEKKFNDGVIRNHLSDLLEVLKKYLIFKNLDKHPVDARKFLINELSSRKLNNILEKELKDLDKDLCRSKNIDGNYLLNRFQIETDKFNFSIVNNKLSGKMSVKQDIDILIKRGEYLICFFIMELLKEADNLDKYSRIFNYELGSNIVSGFINKINLEDLIELIKEEKIDISYVFEIYFYLWKAFREMDNEDHFFKLKQIVTRNQDSFSNDEKHFLFGKMIEYLIIKNRSYYIDNKYDLELLEMYDYFLSNELYKSRRNDYLMVDLYRNILINGIRSGDLAWTENFIAKNINMLHPDYRENMNFYSHAVLNFERGDFNAALDYLNKVKLDLFVFKFDVKNYQIMISYELKMYEMVLQLIDTYKHFLSSHELVSDSRRKVVKKFLKFISLILKLRLDGKGEDPYVIIKEIDAGMNEKLLKKWLIKKAGELL